MLGLVVLFTIFLGLVGVLVVCGEWQRKRSQRAAKSHDPAANLLRLTAWLEGKGHSFPSAAMVMRVLNEAAKRKLQSEVCE